MAFYLARKKEEQLNAQVSDICKRKLLGYAESFQALAGSFGGEMQSGEGDRSSVLCARRFWESRQAISNNLREVSHIIENVADEVFTYQPLEERKRRVIVHALRAEGIVIEDICYIPGIAEGKALGISMYSENREGRSSKDVAGMISVLLKQAYEVSVTSPYKVDRTSRSFVFLSEARYIALTGFARVVKDSEMVSGDSYSFLESEKGKLTMLLSDGTGSGEQAGNNSEKVLDLMEKMLEVGYSMEVAVELVNSALFCSGEEHNYPTLDICDICLYDGDCSFYKIGGAVSFVRHAGTPDTIQFDEGEHRELPTKVDVVEGGSLPLGVFQLPQIQHKTLRLMQGDYVIMMSDGVTDALSEKGYEEAMYAAVQELTEQNPRMIAQQLLQMAIRAGQGHIRDDMTILVAGIWEKE